MKPWASKILRLLGVINLAIGAFGLALVVNGLRSYATQQELRFEGYAYFFSVSFNLVCLLVLLLSGLLLWRRDGRGIKLSKWLFGIEIAYFVATALLSLWLTSSQNPAVRAVGLSIAAVGGTGNMGIALQIVTGYPIIALVLLTLIGRSLRHTKSEARLA
jgi:hypothetical protein